MPLLPAALISSMLYFQMVIMAGTVMLAYYFEYTDTFTVNVQGFFCHDSAYRKPYPGPEDSSAVPPVLLYSLAAGVPVLVIIVGETAVFCLQLATRDFENQEKTILTGDCCYINPLVRRTVRFLGIYTFGLFATDIFVNAGQVVTGNLAPHFLALCKPNYTALGCQQYTQFISGEEACTGNPDLIMRARKTFPSKEAALSVYAAMYLTIIVGETAVFCLQLATRDFENQEKTILTGDCCYINPLVRRTVRFLGIYTFGLFATDIFVNAGQVVTGNLAPHFLALCKPNYTALGCQQYTQFISGEEACTGNPDLIMRARKTFPSKEAALSVYAAMYLTMYITNTIKAKGTRLAKPVLCLGLMCLAFLTGLNRVAEYRNHWSDVIAGFLVGISIAVFLVVCVVNNFKGRQPENGHTHRDNVARMPMINIPRVESPLEKNHITAFAEVT